MNKSELINSIAREANFPSRTASSIVDTILDAMTESLVNGENVEIRANPTLSKNCYLISTTNYDFIANLTLTATPYKYK